MSIEIEEPCTLFTGKRDEDGGVWCRTCAQYVRITARDDPLAWPEKRIDHRCPRDAECSR